MKKLLIILAATVGALNLTACQSTSSSPTPSAAATAATVCGASAGLTYNSATGQWVNSSGVPVACSATTGAYGYGTTGYGTGYGTGTGYGGTGCAYWSSVYPGSTYVPMVDASTGNTVCVNASAYGISIPSNYTYSAPIYSSACPYNQYNDPNWIADCYGGSSYGYGYGSSGSSGSCMAVGDSSGDFYGFCM